MSWEPDEIRLDPVRNEKKLTHETPKTRVNQ